MWHWASLTDPPETLLLIIGGRGCHVVNSATPPRADALPSLGHSEVGPGTYPRGWGPTLPGRAASLNIESARANPARWRPSKLAGWTGAHPAAGARAGRDAHAPRRDRHRARAAGQGPARTGMHERAGVRAHHAEGWRTHRGLRVVPGKRDLRAEPAHSRGHRMGLSPSLGGEGATSQ